MAWPDGPARPGVATAAIVLGFVTGGLTALASLFFLVAVASGGNDPVTVLLLLGLPCAVGLIAGAAQLLQRRTPTLLFGSAVAAVAVLLLTLVTGWVAFDDGDDRVGVTVFLLLAAPLPVLTAVYARLRRVTGWAGAAAG
ncbi:hypothetical protein [Geodermatophilus sp. SYSU D00965]